MACLPFSSAEREARDGLSTTVSPIPLAQARHDAGYSNAQQRVDFAYLSYHDVALVSKGLAQAFYGMGPKYSYFDGCSQGGHEALGEIQRYPADFNGVLAGAPASITTELNSVLHEYAAGPGPRATRGPRPGKPALRVGLVINVVAALLK